LSWFGTAFRADESGATAIEYGLIAALVCVVLVTAVGALGAQLATIFGNVVAAFS
jgi:pilus assembly protein Flp/PilA